MQVGERLKLHEVVSNGINDMWVTTESYVPLCPKLKEYCSKFLFLLRGFKVNTKFDLSNFFLQIIKYWAKDAVYFFYVDSFELGKKNSFLLWNNQRSQPLKYMFLSFEVSILKHLYFFLSHFSPYHSCQCWRKIYDKNSAHRDWTKKKKS